VSGRLKTKDKGNKLREGAAVYGFLRAVYGFQEKEMNMTELDLEEKGRMKSLNRTIEEESKEWASVLLQGFKRDPKALHRLKKYVGLLERCQKNGPEWHNTWIKSRGAKKLLIGFKFLRFVSVYQQSCFPGVRAA